MNERRPCVWLAKPELSDATAAQLLDLLHELLTAFENAYFDQLHRYYAGGGRTAESNRLPPPQIDPDKDPF